MSLIISGSGSITGLTTGAGIPANALSGVLPDANAPSGSVIQVVSVSKSDAFSYSSSDTSAFSDVTGASVTITPTSTSSKIFINVSTNMGFGTTGARGSFRLMRDSTAISIGDADGSRTRSTNGGIQVPGASMLFPYSFTFLDSPNTTSATTYKIQINGESGATYYVNRSASGSTTSDTYTATTNIIVMEIAA
jgi:hypothetical protein